MRKVIAGLSMLLVVAFASAGCMNTAQQQQRHDAVKQRAQSFQRAENQVPVKTPSTYPERQLLNDLVDRQSSLNHPWYVYQFGVNGNVVRYFVAKQFPVNNCDYLSSTEDVDSDNNLVLHAPSLLGIYQSGNDNCGTYVFEDAVTNAIETAPIADVIVSDKPTTLNVGAVKVKVTK